jgi:hypothetical protein
MMVAGRNIIGWAIFGWVGGLTVGLLWSILFGLYCYFEFGLFPDFAALGFALLLPLMVFLASNAFLIAGLLGSVCGVICAFFPTVMRPWKLRVALLAMIHLAFLIFYYFGGLQKLSTPFDAM